MATRIPLPEAVARIYRATAELEASYPGRKFTPDGHLVGSIGEVVAAEALGLTLYPMSQPGHDAHDANGDVQIKMTAGTRVSMYAKCDRLVFSESCRRKKPRSFMTAPGNESGRALENRKKTGSDQLACPVSAPSPPNDPRLKRSN